MAISELGWLTLPKEVLQLLSTPKRPHWQEKPHQKQPLNLDLTLGLTLTGHISLYSCLWHSVAAAGNREAYQKLEVDN